MPKRKILTDAVIRQAPPPKSDHYDIFDARTLGLFVRVSRLRKTFYVYKRIRGETPRRLKVGEYRPEGMPEPFTLEQARDKAGQMLALMGYGENPREVEEQNEAKRQAEEAARQREEVNTFGNARRRFVKEYSEANIRHPERDEQVFATYCAAWDDMKMRDIKHAHISTLVKDVAKTKPQMAIRLRQRLKMLFGWAKHPDRGMIAVDADPTEFVEAPAKQSKSTRTPKAHELVAIWRGSEKLGAPWRQYVQALVLMGQRRSEVSTMEWSEVDMETAMWSLPAEKNKSGRGAEIPLSDAMLDILRSLPRLGRFVFSTTGGDAPISGFSKLKISLDEEIAAWIAEQAEQAPTGRWGRLAADCRRQDKPVNLPAWRLHDLRRSVSSTLAEMKVNQEIVKTILNHGEVAEGLEAVYNTYEYLPEKREIMKKWAEYVLAQVSEAPQTNVIPLRA